MRRSLTVAGFVLASFALGCDGPAPMGAQGSGTSSGGSCSGVLVTTSIGQGTPSAEPASPTVNTQCVSESDYARGYASSPAWSCGRTGATAQCTAMVPSAPPQQ
jgi:hypothetical protein